MVFRRSYSYLNDNGSTLDGCLFTSSRSQSTLSSFQYIHSGTRTILPGAIPGLFSVRKATSRLWPLKTKGSILEASHFKDGIITQRRTIYQAAAAWQAPWKRAMRTNLQTMALRWTTSTRCTRLLGLLPPYSLGSTTHHLLTCHLNRLQLSGMRIDNPPIRLLLTRIDRNIHVRIRDCSQ